MSFHSEGTFKVTITETCIAVCKSKKVVQGQGFDVCLKVDDGNGQSDYMRYEFSHNTIQNGNNAGKSWAEISRNSLMQLGIPGGDPMQHAVLLNTQTDATTKMNEYNGKNYYNLSYLGGNNSPSSMDQAQAAQIMAMLTSGGQPQQQMQQQAPAAPPVFPAQGQPQQQMPQQGFQQPPVNPQDNPFNQ